MDDSRAPRDHKNIRMLQTMISGVASYWALEPECQSLMFVWSCGPLDSPVNSLRGGRQLWDSLRSCGEVAGRCHKGSRLAGVKTKQNLESYRALLHALASGWKDCARTCESFRVQI